MGAGIWMRPPGTILRMHPVTLRGPGYSHEYVVGRRTGDSRLRGNDGRGAGMTRRRDSRLRGNDGRGGGWIGGVGRLPQGGCNVI